MLSQNQIKVSASEETVVADRRVVVVHHRGEGFKVFLDEETNETARMLNQIRLHASPEVVIMAVSLVRGLQVGINYSKKYAPHLTFEIEQQLTKLLSEACGKRLIP